ncbi:MAG: hypothetical protein ACE5RI_08780 [Candidatus Nitrosomaritimum yanchengensis]
MRTGNRYELIERPEKVHLRPSSISILKGLQIRYQFASSDLITKHGSNDSSAVYNAIHAGIKGGILKIVKDLPTTFAEFSQFETVAYFASQMRGSKMKTVMQKLVVLESSIYIVMGI